MAPPSPLTAMANRPKQPPDALSALAERYLDLCQQHMTALASDHRLAETLRLWHHWWRAAGRPAERDHGPGDEFGADRPAAGLSPRRPAAAGPASGDGGGDLDELRRRLRQLEDRLAALERDSHR
ncbi:MAG: hypothetical protein QGF33_02220 [Alphaproteobacteria bacterium]|nr:hypothetical protein [Alphaproteobacteria bacterium]